MPMRLVTPQTKVAIINAHGKEPETLEVDGTEHARVTSAALHEILSKKRLKARKVLKEGTKRGLKNTRHLINQPNSEQLQTTMC